MLAHTYTLHTFLVRTGLRSKVAVLYHSEPVIARVRLVQPAVPALPFRQRRDVTSCQTRGGGSSFYSAWLCYGAFLKLGPCFSVRGETKVAAAVAGPKG